MNETPTEQLPPEPPPEPKRLLRAREGRVIGGVCAGLGRYFNVDPIMFRIGAIVLALRRAARASSPTSPRCS